MQLALPTVNILCVSNEKQRAPVSAYTTENQK